MNIARLEDRLVVVCEPVGVSVYDFDFDLNFRCDHPYRFEQEECCVFRVGAVTDYEFRFQQALGWGLRMVNSPPEHLLASELEHWYPRLHDLTPRTEIFDELPPAEEIESKFRWPIFLKGSRQTSKHNAELSIIESPEAYRVAAQAYLRNDILHWQKAVVREFVQLHPVQGTVPGMVRPSLEYRSFWWRGFCVGWGRYWYQIPSYGYSDAEVGLGLAKEAAGRLKVPFLVIDFAKTADGRWIVIECNDAQESGYCAIAPRPLWNRILFGEDVSSP